MVNVSYDAAVEGERYMDEREDGQYRYYQLHLDAIALLPAHRELVVSLESGRAILMDWHTRTVLADRQFGSIELSISLALLNVWPASLPLEKLLPLALPAEDPELVQLWLRNARTCGEESLRILLRPLKQGIAKCNVQLAAFDLTIATIVSPPDSYCLASTQSTKGGA